MQEHNELVILSRVKTKSVRHLVFPLHNWMPADATSATASTRCALSKLVTSYGHDVAATALNIYIPDLYTDTN